MPDEFLTNFRDPSVSKPMISKAPCKNKQMLCDIPGSRDKMKMKAYGRETNSGDMESVSFLVSSFPSPRSLFNIGDVLVIVLFIIFLNKIRSTLTRVTNTNIITYIIQHLKILNQNYFCNPYSANIRITNAVCELPCDWKTVS